MPDVFLKKDTDVISPCTFCSCITRKSEKEVDGHHIIPLYLVQLILLYLQ